MGRAILLGETADYFRETHSDWIHRRRTDHRCAGSSTQTRPAEPWILVTLLLGVVGSVIGGTIAHLIGTGDIMELNVLGFIFAVIASLLLLGVAESMSGRRT